MGNAYCNSVKKVQTSNNGIPNVLGKDVPGAPTIKEIEAADSVEALLQLQFVPVKSKTVKQASTFYDPGSNVNLVRKGFAKEAGWKGRPVLQTLQTTGGRIKAWQTEAYYVPLVDGKGGVHKVLAYSIDMITAPIDHVDVVHGGGDPINGEGQHAVDCALSVNQGNMVSLGLSRLNLPSGHF